MTFGEDVGEVVLIPGTGGIFDIRVDGEMIYSKKSAGRFPEAKELKQLVRDKIAPEKHLGHSEAEDKGQKAEDSILGDL